jgi:hypothetical protein
MGIFRGKRKQSSRSRGAPGRFPLGLFLLSILVIVETLWLALFIWGTSSLLPSGLSGRLPQPAAPEVSRPVEKPVPDEPTKTDELKLQELLERKGSRGPAATPAAR